MRTDRQRLIGYRQCGVTLIEQLMVLVIVGVLIGIATPSMHKLLVRHELQTAQTDLMVALHQARSTAVTSGKRTLLCPSTDGLHCATTTHWEHGWLLGVDADHDNQPDGAPRYSGVSHAHNLLIRSSAGRHLVRFQPNGSAGGSNLTLLFCEPASHNPTLSVVVSNSGRVRGAPASAAQAAACAQGG
ncbi:MAG: GspH/FimT family pseudopilin [Rhodanobacter sp.]